MDIKRQILDIEKENKRQRNHRGSLNKLIEISGKAHAMRLDLEMEIGRLGDQESHGIENALWWARERMKVHRSAFKDLLWAVDSGPDWAKSLAARELWGLDDSRILESLMRSLRSEDHKLRASAAFALGWQGNTLASRDLLNLLNDSDDQVRASAAFALGNIGSATVVSVLNGSYRPTHQRITDIPVVYALAQLGAVPKVTIVSAVPSSILHQDEYRKWEVTIENQGTGPTVVTNLEVVGPWRGEQVAIGDLLPKSRKQIQLLLCPDATGEQVPFGLVASYQTVHPSRSPYECLGLSTVEFQTTVSVFRPGIASADKLNTSSGAITNCPECAERFSTTSAPNFCPFCGKALSG